MSTMKEQMADTLAQLEYIADASKWCSEGLAEGDKSRALANLASISSHLRSILANLDMPEAEQHAFLTCCSIHEFSNKEGS